MAFAFVFFILPCLLAWSLPSIFNEFNRLTMYKWLVILLYLPLSMIFVIADFMQYGSENPLQSGIIDYLSYFQDKTTSVNFPNIFLRSFLKKRCHMEK